MNRRHFAALTTAFALLAPDALAGDEPKGLPALSLVPVLGERTPNHATFQVAATYTGRGGMSVSFEVIEAGWTHGAEEHQAMAWLNDAHPLSRKVPRPASVDIASQQTLNAAVLHVQIPPGLTGTTELQLHAVIRVRHRRKQRDFRFENVTAPAV